MQRPLPPELQPLVDSAITMAREKLEAGDEMAGVALIDVPELARKGDLRNGMVAIEMSALPTKDAWARAVRTVSSFVEARFVMVVSEIWVHTGTQAGEVERQLKLHKEVRLIPGRREAVLVQVETHDGLWQGIAELKLLATAAGREHKTFDAIELTMPQHNEGRLVGLLGRPGTAPS